MGQLRETGFTGWGLFVKCKKKLGSKAENVSFPCVSVLILHVCVADDGNMVPAEHGLQMLLPDKSWDEGGAHRRDLHAFPRTNIIC